MSFLNKKTLNKLIAIILISNIILTSSSVEAKKNKSYQQAESFCNSTVQKTPSVKCFVIQTGTTTCNSHGRYGRTFGSRQVSFIKGRTYGSGKKSYFTCTVVPINTSDPKYKETQTWCSNYLRRNPRMRCEIKPNIERCPTGTYIGMQSGGSGLRALTGFRACVNGSRNTLNPPDYVLQCRGGGSMYTYLYRAVLRRQPENIIEIYGLKKSRSAANKRPPGNGECAWIDRPLSSKEPTKLIYKLAKRQLFNKILIRPTGATIGWVNGSDPILKVIQAIYTKQLFYLHVHNNNQGALEIDRIGI